MPTASPAAEPRPGTDARPPDVGAPAPARTARQDQDVAGLGRGRALGFVAPALVVIGIFLVFPAIWTIYLGLLDYSLSGSGAKEPVFVGLGNYVEALGDPGFHRSLYLTLLYVGGSAVIGQNILGFLLAWYLRSAHRFVRPALTILVLLAWILPGSVVAFLWQALLDRRAGTLNAILDTSGQAWVLDHPMLVIVIFNIWRGAAFSMLLYSAALNTVPRSHLEVARMSGARGWQQLRDVVLPTVKRHVLTNTLLITLWTFNDFSPYLLTGGGPNGASEILPVYIYREAIIGGDLGYGSAISLLLLLANLVIAVFYLRVLRTKKEDAA
ncbi:carbohydrate ABC transporter permease [uncultured Phycicoccus sp.]|uniref:carbohydrate ABC transporter permease n=1 Tax=uncultured Phycicoccus sp. TaxID=661422 RepID=UPI00262AFF86|nr:sugar ABC transporter permease [uncultured Phycicoccus sp.]